jgi:hypothetical protein
MQQIIDLLTSNMSTIITILVASGVVSGLTQGFKHWLNLESPKVIMFLTVTLSFLATILPFIISSAGQNPTLLGSHTFEIIGAATFLYRFAIQPLSAFFANYKAYRSSSTTASINNTAVATVNAPAALAVPTAAIVEPAAAPSSTNEFIG